MLADLIKLFADEPEKIERAVLKAINIALGVIIAAQLYRWLIGGFVVIDIGNYQQLAAFVLTGRVMICLLLYFISHYLILSSLYWMAQRIATVVAHRKVNVDKRDVRSFLQSMGVFSRSSDGKLLPGKHINVVHTLSDLFARPEAPDEVRSLQDSFIENVWGVYFSFAVVYWTVIGPLNITVSILVVTFLIMLIVLYRVIYLVIHFLLENHQQISAGLAFIKCEAAADRVFSRYLIFPEHPPKGTGLSRHKSFTRNDTEFIWIHLPHGETFKYSPLENLIHKRGDGQRVFIVAVCRKYLSDDLPLSGDHPAALKLILYTDEAQLAAQLDTLLSSSGQQ